MALTNKQKMLLHLVPQKLGIDEAARRIIQQTFGNFYSAKDASASHEGFAAVLAHYERCSGGQLEGYTPGYWHAADAANQQGGPSDRMAWRIRQIAKQLSVTDEQLDQFIAGPRMTNGKYGSLADCPPYWQRKILQALIEISRRKEAG